MTPKEKADALVQKHIKYTSGWTSTNKPLEPAASQYEGVKMKLGRAIHCAILSVEHTIEVLNKILAHDKERYGITSRGATIELDEQTELLKELKLRLGKYE